jgi:hypothetical protein
MTTIDILPQDRNFIESMKRRLNLKTNSQTLHAILKEFKKHKLHLDMEPKEVKNAKTKKT